jgi:hypothetical protein
MRRRFSRTFAPLILVFCAGFMMGCLPAEQTAEEDAETRAAVVGTWKYRVDGAAPLDEGVFRITTQDGRLRGILQDRRLGRLRARVDVNGSRLELSFDNFLISGYVENNEFTGFLERQRWNVASQSEPRRRSQFSSVSLLARRVQRAGVADKPSILECRSILREANGCN